jgi:2-oxoglutarate dehydrogenase complex dehydrogenase (E1) component-like enzyme
MATLVDKNTKVITQGMTGETGTFHTRQALDPAQRENFNFSVYRAEELLVTCRQIEGGLA